MIHWNNSSFFFALIAKCDENQSNSHQDTYITFTAFKCTYFYTMKSILCVEHWWMFFKTLIRVIFFVSVVVVAIIVVVVVHVLRPNRWLCWFDLWSKRKKNPNDTTARKTAHVVVNFSCERTWNASAMWIDRVDLAQIVSTIQQFRYIHSG